jgi:thymidylate kinase
MKVYTKRWLEIIVAIEGVDGSGKTTQARLLVNRLIDNGYDAIYIRPIFLLVNTISKLFFNNNLASVSPRRSRTSKTNQSNTHLDIVFLPLAYIYASVTYIFIRTIYRKKVVVCDRYFYQFFYDLCGSNCALLINRFPKPDVTFFLIGDLDLLYSRMDSSFDSQVCREYYYNVLNMYSIISDTSRSIRINADKSKEHINDEIFNNVIKL